MHISSLPSPFPILFLTSPCLFLCLPFMLLIPGIFSLTLPPPSPTALAPATHKQIGPFWCWSQGGVVCVHSRTLWVSPTNSPVGLGVSQCHNPHRFLQSEVLRLSFPELEPWVVWSISLLSCFFWFILMQMWSSSCCLAHPVLQPLPCHASSLPLLAVWRNVSSLTRWLSDFHTARFSVSYGCFLFLQLLSSFFLLCKEAAYLPMPPLWPEVLNSRVWNFQSPGQLPESLGLARQTCQALTPKLRVSYHAFETRWCLILTKGAVQLHPNLLLDWIRKKKHFLIGKNILLSCCTSFKNSFEHTAKIVSQVKKQENVINNQENKDNVCRPTDDPDVGIR